MRNVDHSLREWNAPLAEREAYIVRRTSSLKAQAAMSVKRFWWVGVLLIAGGALYLFGATARHRADPSLPADPLGWLWNWFDEPGPPDIGQFGHIVAGEFEDAEEYPVWMVTRDSELVGVDPAACLHGQIVVPRSDGDAAPASEMMARVQSFREDGTPISPGVLVRFVRFANDPHSVTYRATKPVLLVDTARFEGEHRELIAVLGQDGSSTRIIAP